MKGRSRKKVTSPIGWKTPTILAALVALIAVVSLAGYGYSKFLTQKHLTGNVEFTSKLVQAFTLQEHKATQNTDGSYSLSTEVVQTNAYLLIPGIDLPKDPFLTITGKTNIPAYLYVEVVDNKLPAPRATYALTSDWKELTGVTGAHNGKIYVYAPGGTAKILTDTNTVGTVTIDILQDKMVKIEQGSSVAHNHEPFDGTATQLLDFYGYLLQIEEGQTESIVFTSNMDSNYTAPTVAP